MKLLFCGLAIALSSTAYSYQVTLKAGLDVARCDKVCDVVGDRGAVKSFTINIPDGGGNPGSIQLNQIRDGISFNPFILVWGPPTPGGKGYFIQVFNDYSDGSKNHNIRTMTQFSSETLDTLPTMELFEHEEVKSAAKATLYPVVWLGSGH